MIRAVAIFISLFLSAKVFAVEVTKEKGGRIFVTDRCADAIEIAGSLKSWISNENLKKNCDLSLPSNDDDGDFCRIDVTDCVPEHVVKYQGVYPADAGPNCWNLALVMKQILPSMRYTTPEEMAFYMQPPLCRQLSDREPRQAGDIGAIRDMSRKKRGALETHGFIYISEKISYSKNGYSQNSPYALQSLEEVYKTYSVSQKEECRRNELNTSGACGTAVSYFRCQSLDTYLRENPQLPAEISASLRHMTEFESCLQQRALNGESISDSQQTQILNVAKALAWYLNDQTIHNRKMGMKDEERNFVLGALQMRLDSIAKQLDMSNKSQLSLDLFLLKETIAESVTSLTMKTK